MYHTSTDNIHISIFKYSEKKTIELYVIYIFTYPNDAPDMYSD